MKKIVLFSLIMCGMIYGNVSFAAATCRKTPSGEVVCNYINTGGGWEAQLCFKSEQESATNPDPEVWEDWNTGLWRWAKKVGQDCTNGKPGAKTAKCIDNHLVRGEETPLTRSCAAYECLSDYLLYTTNKRKEIDVIGKNQKVGSQGLCRSKSYLKSLCDAGCGCGEKEECVLNEVTVKNHGKNVKAFIGEELCVCVADDNGGGQGVKPEADPEKPCTPSKCKITLNQGVRCKNGNHIKERRQYQICEEDLAKLQTIDCKEAEKLIMECDNMDCIEKYITQTKKFKELIAELCEDGNVSYVPDSARLEEAKRSVSSFFASAKKDVWKDAEGNFNTARLASDLTAGVVLGTVGGVVSGVVIKKKQIEKGFDALHCAVGGQNIADWGDIFNVGLRR